MLRRSFVLMAAFALVLWAANPSAADEKGGKTHEGKVVSAGGGKLTMTDKDGKNEHTHNVAATAKITCGGKDCKLEDLKKGYPVKVTTGKDGGKDVATKIEAQKS